MIDFKIGLYIKVNNEAKQLWSPYLKKFGQNGHPLAQNRPDGAWKLNLHNSIIFNPILTFLNALSLEKSNGDNN